MMCDGFSAATREFLDRYDIVQTAFDQFHNELAAMYAELSSRIDPLGFASNNYRFKTGRHLHQFSRSNWHNEDGGGVHFEFFINLEELSHRRVVVGLDIDDAVGKRKLRRDRLVRLLAPHERTLQNRYGYELRRGKDWKLLRGTLPIQGLTVDAMAAKCAVLPAVATYVDEALFLRGSKRVWRTSFLTKSKRPRLEWHENLGTGPQGGWELSSDGGRFDSVCLKCHGGRSNYHDGKNILMLRAEKPFCEFHTGETVQACAVVHAAQGGTLEFYAEAPKEGKWQVAFHGVCEVAPVDRWQLVTWKGQVAQPEDYDFAKQGLFAFVMVKTPAAGLRIDSIELGVCRNRS